MGDFRMFATALLAFASVAAAAESSPSLPSSVLNRLHTLSDRFIAVQVWSPVCGPCGEEVAELNTVMATAKKDGLGLRVIGIPVHARSRDVIAFTTHFKPQFEEWEVDSSLDSVFQSVPILILLDQERKSVKTWIGKFSEVEFLSELKQRSQI
jgi:hypothetical protein